MSENLPYTITLNGPADHKLALKALDRAPVGYTVTFNSPRRTLHQNDRMWAMLTDIARQVEYYGKKRNTHAWKDIFTAALRKAETVPSLDGEGIVQIGLRTSKMNKQQISDLMELMAAYGAEHGVEWSDDAKS